MRRQSRRASGAYGGWLLAGREAGRCVQATGCFSWLWWWWAAGVSFSGRNVIELDGGGSHES